MLNYSLSLGISFIYSISRLFCVYASIGPFYCLDSGKFSRREWMNNVCVGLLHFGEIHSHHFGRMQIACDDDADDDALTLIHAKFISAQYPKYRASYSIIANTIDLKDDYPH